MLDPDQRKRFKHIFKSAVNRFHSEVYSDKVNHFCFYLSLMSEM